MDEQQAAELRVLRARAYGPDADISADPAALARLHELEQRSTAEAAVATADAVAWGPPPDDPFSDDDTPALAGPALAETAPGFAAVLVDRVPEAPDAAELPGSEAASSDGPGIDDPSTESEPDAAPAHRSRRRTILLWASSLVVAALIGAGVTYATSDPAIGAVAVLDVDPDGEWPEAYGGQGDNGIVFDEFYGLSVIYSPYAGGEDGTSCMFVTLIQDSPEANNNVFTAGCAAGSFAASASIPVTASMPDDLLERFPEGSTLQFVKDDSRVLVYAASP